MRFPRPRDVEYRVVTTGLGSGSWLTEALGGTPTMSGERVTPSKAMGLVGVYAATYKIAELVGTLPLKVYRTLDDDQRIEARAHRSWKILHDKPNEYTTAAAFWSTVAAQMVLLGGSFLWKKRDVDGLVESLWITDPATWEIKTNDAGERIYVQTVGMGRRSYTVDEITYIAGFSLDGVRGVSRIEYCRQTFGKALARDRFEGTFYRDGAHTAGVIEYPGTLGEDGVTNLARSFRAKHGGAGKQHGVPVLEAGASFKATQMSLADQQFVEQAQLSLTEIAVLFDLPPGELGGMHGGSLEYSTEEMNQIRLTRAVIPYTNRIAKALSSDPDVLPWNVMYAEFLAEAAMRPDTKATAEWWKFVLDNKLATPAYVAARLNLPEPPKPEPVPAPLAAANQVADPSAQPDNVATMNPGMIRAAGS